VRPRNTGTCRGPQPRPSALRLYLGPRPRVEPDLFPVVAAQPNRPPLIVDTPDLQGLTLEDAASVAADYGLVVDVDPVETDAADYGTVIAQEPLSGEAVYTGATNDPTLPQLVYHRPARQRHPPPRLIHENVQVH